MHDEPFPFSQTKKETPETVDDTNFSYVLTTNWIANPLRESFKKTDACPM